MIRHGLAIGNRSLAEVTAAEIKAMERDPVRLADLLAWAPGANISLLVEVKDRLKGGPRVEATEQRVNEIQKIIKEGYVKRERVKKDLSDEERNAIERAGYTIKGEYKEIAKMLRGLHKSWK